MYMGICDNIVTLRISIGQRNTIIVLSIYFFIISDLSAYHYYSPRGLIIESKGQFASVEGNLFYGP